MQFPTPEPSNTQISPSSCKNKRQRGFQNMTPYGVIKRRKLTPRSVSPDSSFVHQNASGDSVRESTVECKTETSTRGALQRGDAQNFETAAFTGLQRTTGLMNHQRGQIEMQHGDNPRGAEQYTRQQAQHHQHDTMTEAEQNTARVLQTLIMSGSDSPLLALAATPSYRDTTHEAQNEESHQMSHHHAASQYDSVLLWGAMKEEYDRRQELAARQRGEFSQDLFSTVLRHGPPHHHAGYQTQMRPASASFSSDNCATTSASLHAPTTSTASESVPSTAELFSSLASATALDSPRTLSGSDVSTPLSASTNMYHQTSADSNSGSGMLSSWADDTATTVSFGSSSNTMNSSGSGGKGATGGTQLLAQYCAPSHVSSSHHFHPHQQHQDGVHVGGVHPFQQQSQQQFPHNLIATQHHQQQMETHHHAQQHAHALIQDPPHLSQSASPGYHPYHCSSHATSYNSASNTIAPAHLVPGYGQNSARWIEESSGNVHYSPTQFHGTSHLPSYQSSALGVLQQQSQPAAMTFPQPHFMQGGAHPMGMPIQPEYNLQHSTPGVSMYNYSTPSSVESSPHTPNTATTTTSTSSRNFSLPHDSTYDRSRFVAPFTTTSELSVPSDAHIIQECILTSFTAKAKLSIRKTNGLLDVRQDKVFKIVFHVAGDKDIKFVEWENSQDKISTGNMCYVEYLGVRFRKLDHKSQSAWKASEDTMQIQKRNFVQKNRKSLDIVFKLPRTQHQYCGKTIGNYLQFIFRLHFLPKNVRPSQCITNPPTNGYFTDVGISFVCATKKKGKDFTKVGSVSSKDGTSVVCVTNRIPSSRARFTRDEEGVVKSSHILE